MTTRNAATIGLYGSEWQSHSYCGHAGTADQVDRHAGRSAIVVGGARGVFDEVKRAAALLEDPIIFAANDVGMYLPKLDHWCSLHGANLGAWKAVRWLQQREKEVTEYHSPDKFAYIDHCWEGLTPLFALSGYFAMQLAWVMGCTQIVLCGCPGDDTPRFFDYTQRINFAYSEQGVQEQLEKEMRRIPEFRAAVRSMSGWTQTYFGGL